MAQGHTDDDKEFLLHCYTTLHQYSIPLLVSILAMNKFRLCTHDGTQACLQSDETLSGEIYVRPTREFGLEPNKILKLKRSLYGLTDTGVY